jgi:hypothetical protein
MENIAKKVRFLNHRTTLEIFKDVKNFSLGLTSTTNAAPYLW